MDQNKKILLEVAKVAMQGLLSRERHIGVKYEELPQKVAIRSVEYALALLKEVNNCETGIVPRETND